MAGGDVGVDPDFLVVRSTDHVLFGVHASGCRVVAGNPPKLIAESAAANLVLTFPPQHVAEEIFEGEASPNPQQTWQARLAGPSRVAFDLSLGTELELTGAGILGALNGANLSLTQELTAIELPWGLVISPEPPSSGKRVIARHSVQPVGQSGTVGLWRTRIGTTKGDGEIQIRVLRAGRQDPFPLPLTKANRLLLLQQQPANAQRLELSTLGGSLSAAGKWDTFEWDHDAALGRDQIVRTATKGVLYPLGHKAVFVELSERSLDEPIAVLRKKRILYVTEAVRGAVDEPRLSRAFPFADVEITTHEFSGLADPHWESHDRPTRQIAQLRQRQEALDDLISEASENIHGDMGYSAGPVMEDFAEELEEARECTLLQAEREAIQRAIAILQKLGQSVEKIPVYFMPRSADGGPLRFPVRCHAPNGDMHFDLPMYFIADVKLRDFLREDFDSLNNDDITERVQKEYAASGEGMVDLRGQPIDLMAGSGDLSLSQ